MTNQATKTFPLAYPVEVGGETITSVTLRRPKGREVRALQSGAGANIDRSFKLMADLAEVQLEVFDEMDAADIRKIDGWLNEILGE